MLTDLKMPGALETIDRVLTQVDSGAATAGEAIERVLNAQIALRNNVALHPYSFCQTCSARTANTRTISPDPLRRR